MLYHNLNESDSTLLELPCKTDKSPSWMSVKSPVDDEYQSRSALTKNQPLPTEHEPLLLINRGEPSTRISKASNAQQAGGVGPRLKDIDTKMLQVRGASPNVFSGVE